jgi:hypothetical protein
MSTVRDKRVEQRGGRAGCPPLLEVDLVHTDVLGPAVEWPPAPPTRRTTPEAPEAEVADVTALTTARAVRLLDASESHLRTALEASAGTDAGDRIQEAIADIARARDALATVVTSDG